MKVAVCLTFTNEQGQIVKNYAVINDTSIDRLLIEPIILKQLGDPPIVGASNLTFSSPMTTEQEARDYNMADASKYAAAASMTTIAKKKTKKVKAAKKKRSPSSFGKKAKKAKAKSPGKSYYGESSFGKKTDGAGWITMGNGKKLKMKKKK
jgi:hypothetical protein